MTRHLNVEVATIELAKVYTPQPGDVVVFKLGSHEEEAPIVIEGLRAAFAHVPDVHVVLITGDIEFAGVVREESILGPGGP